MDSIDKKTTGKKRLSTDDNKVIENTADGVSCLIALVNNTENTTFKTYDELS